MWNLLTRWWPRRGGDALLRGVIAPLDGGVALVVMQLRPQERPLLRSCLFRPGVDERARGRVVAELVREHHCQKASWFGVLPPGGYQLFPAEPPDVPFEEMAQALRWRVKDRLEFPVEEAVVEVFPQPPKAAGGSARSVYVVAARRNEVQRLVDLFQGAKLDLKAIDITELALRNLAVLTPDDQEGLGLLVLWQRQGMVLAVRQGRLYLARQFEMGYEQVLQEVEGKADAPREVLMRSPSLDRVAVEVQRTMDYYESHFTRVPASCLYVAPLGTPMPHLREALADLVGMRIKELEMGELVESGEGVQPADLARCLTLVGASLRGG